MTTVTKICGNCEKEVEYRVSSSSGLYYHVHSGKWQCDDGKGDANTYQLIRITHAK